MVELASEEQLEGKLTHNNTITLVVPSRVIRGQMYGSCLACSIVYCARVCVCETGYVSDLNLD